MAKRRRTTQPRPSSRTATSSGGARAGSPRGANPRPDSRLIIIVGSVIAFLLIGTLGTLFAGTPTNSPSALGSTAPAGSSSAEASAPAQPGPTSTSSEVSSPAASLTAIDGVPCDPVAHDDDFHVHAHLNIRVEGQLTLPPAYIGVTPGCLFWIHTHQAYGVIHVEAPSEATFTLGQFFAIWGKPLTATRVADATVGPGQALFVFVDRQRVETADPASIALRDLEAIELQIGNVPREPLPYTFPADLGGG